MSDTWEKHVDKATEKFREQAYKAVYQFHGSTYSAAAADALATAYAIMVKGRDVPKVIDQIFTKEFLSQDQTAEESIREKE